MSDLHRAAGFGALRSYRFVGDLLDQRQACALFADQRLCRDARIFEIDFRSAASVDGCIVARNDTVRAFIDDEDRDPLRVAPLARSARG